MSELEYDRLIDVLANPPEVPYPVILPDFFLDHFVIAGDFEDLLDNLRLLAEQGGGNLLGTTQFISRGGNSVNTASALLSLGINPKLIIKTDSHGASILRTLVSPDLDLSHVHTDGSLSSTVSLEVEYEDRKVNLMVSDSGSAADFEFSDLTNHDLETIQNSGLVALLCLNHNRAAAEWAESLFTFVRERKGIKTFLDIGDPSGNMEMIQPLVKRVLTTDLVDILGMNENEAGWFAYTITSDSKWRDTPLVPDMWIPAAQLISDELSIRVDLHTPKFSATLFDENCIIVPTFEVESCVMCGAGDAWNAGDIYGTLLNLQPMDRLLLANTVGALYVSSSSARHPTPNDIIRFLSTNPPL